jgi:hypothetical protein
MWQKLAARYICRQVFKELAGVTALRDSGSTVCLLQSQNVRPVSICAQSQLAPRSLLIEQ